MTIAQGFAQHINNNAESLRPRLVRHAGSLRLKVTTERLHDLGDWAVVVDALGDEIEQHVGPGLVRLMVCDFSTTTPAVRTASQVVMMDSFSRYFDYVGGLICGIPRVTLLGTPQDWASICERVRVIAEYDLGWWTRRLEPICSALHHTAQGDVDTDFWQCIYMPADTYGRQDKMTGWLARLFPYVGSPAVDRNPALDDLGTRFDVFRHDRVEAKDIPPARRQWISDGIYTDGIPPGLSFARIELSCFDKPARLVELFAGFFGVRQRADDGALEPHIGWGIVERYAGKIAAAIRAKHEPLQPKEAGLPGEDDSRDVRNEPPCPGELEELLNEVDGATLFGGRFTLRPRHRLTKIPIVGACHGEAVRFCDLSDGTFVAYVMGRSRESWVIRSDAEGVIWGDTPVIERSVLAFLDRALASGGSYWFEDDDFEPHFRFVDGLLGRRGTKG